MKKSFTKLINIKLFIRNQIFNVRNNESNMNENLLEKQKKKENPKNVVEREKRRKKNHFYGDTRCLIFNFL